MTTIVMYLCVQSIWVCEQLEAETRQNYPGELAEPDDIRRLADEYRVAAHHLAKLGRRGEPLSRAPFRLAAIHAIELYLNAMLLVQGHSASSIRGMQHDLVAKVELAVKSSLKLRKRTSSHLTAMKSNREYLVTRYDPEMTATVSQINRLTATLEEVAQKVTVEVERRRPRS